MAHPCPRPWTEDDLSKLLAMHAAGAPFRDISIALDRSIGSIASRVREPNRPIRSKRAYPKLTRDPYAPVDPRKATFAHLRDILRAHGYNAKWQNLAIGNDCITRHWAVQHENYPAFGQSSMAACEEYA